MEKMLSASTEKEFLKSSSLVLLANCFSQIILFLLNLYLSKKFGPELFGNFKSALYLFTSLPFLVDFGASVTLVKYVAELYSKNREKLSYLVRWFLKLRVFAYFSLLVFLLLLQDKIISLVFKNFDSNLFLVGIVVTASYFFSIFASLVQGLQNFKLYSFILVFSNLLITLFAIPLSNFGVSHALLAWSFGSIAYLFPIKFLWEKKIFEKTKKKVDAKKIFFKFSLPMTFLQAPESLSVVVVPLLSIFFSSTAIGHYSFAFMFYWPTLLIPTALQIVLLPKVSELSGLKNYEKAKRLLKKTIQVYLLIVILGLPSILFFSDSFIHFIAKEYLPSSQIFKSIMIFGLLSGFLVIYKGYYTGLAKLKKVFLIVLIQNLLLFIISFILLSLSSF